MRPVAVKICGLTRSEDVHFAAGLGAWAVGFVLAPSPRRVTLSDARRLAAEARAVRGPLGVRPVAIGVFGDVSAGEVVAAAVEAGLDGVQLHGRSSPGAAAVRAAEHAYVSARPSGQTELARRPSTPLLVIQALAVPPEGRDPRALARDAARARGEGADFVLFDTGTASAFGGTGTGFPWEVAAAAATAGPFLIAGGIGPDDVGEALDRSGAGGVDVSSALETSPGVKDPALMRLLFERLATAGRYPSRLAAAGAWPQPPRPRGRGGVTRIDRDSGQEEGSSR